MCSQGGKKKQTTYFLLRNLESPRVLIVYMAVNMKVCKCRMRTSYIKKDNLSPFASKERVDSPTAGALAIYYTVVQSVEANCSHGLLCQ